MTFRREIDERYRAFAEVSRTRSILSVGVSLFRKHPLSDAQLHGGNSPMPIDVNGDAIESQDQYSFIVENYDFLCKCQDSYKLDEDANRFLRIHGFNFDKQASLGLPYHRGNDVSFKRCSCHSLTKC